MLVKTPMEIDMQRIRLMAATVISAAFLTLPLDASAQDAGNGVGEQRAVLITGASTGIGRTTAERLASEGFIVYAGARKASDLEELDAIDNIRAIRLDVTSDEEIAAAVETVRAGGHGLYALINNAGVAVFAPLIEAREDDIAWGLGGPYCMSKHAIEAYTDSLAAELEPFGVRVSVIDPGNYKSDIMLSLKERLIESGYSTEDSLYKGRLDGFLSSPLDRAQYKEPDEVADAFLDALTSENPKRRYMVVPNKGEAEMTIRSILSRAAQMNDDHEHSFTRDELVAMLDEMIAANTRE